MRLRLPNPRATVRIFWIALGVDVALLVLISYLDDLAHARNPGPDNYAIGIGALLPFAIVALVLLAALLFAVVRWRPWRLLLAATACGMAAFLAMAATWFL